MEHAHQALLLDRRPLYPEVLAFGVPRGTKAMLRCVAESGGISVSDFARRAVARVMSEHPAD